MKTAIITGASSGIGVFQSAAVYCGTKYAVEAITEGIRLELTVPYNIRATSICPGGVETNLMTTITDQEVFAAFEPMLSSVKFLQSEDIAKAIVYAVKQDPNVSVDHVCVRPSNQLMCSGSIKFLKNRKCPLRFFKYFLAMNVVFQYLIATYLMKIIDQ